MFVIIFINDKKEKKEKETKSKTLKMHTKFVDQK